MPDASFDGMDSFITAGKVDYEHLYKALALCRVTKSPAEVEILRYVALVTSNAHVDVMRFARCSHLPILFTPTIHS